MPPTWPHEEPFGQFLAPPGLHHGARRFCVLAVTAFQIVERLSDVPYCALGEIE
jgi:hypothetical protein